jgi:hypothetical protein
MVKPKATRPEKEQNAAIIDHWPDCDAPVGEHIICL